MFIEEIIAWEAVGSKDLNGVKHARLDMTARDKGKGAPDKGHTTSFSPSKVVRYFPNFPELVWHGIWTALEYG